VCPLPRTSISRQTSGLAAPPQTFKLDGSSPLKESSNTDAYVFYAVPLWSPLANEHLPFAPALRQPQLPRLPRLHPPSPHTPTLTPAAAQWTHLHTSVRWRRPPTVRRPSTARRPSMARKSSKLQEDIGIDFEDQYGQLRSELETTGGGALSHVGDLVFIEDDVKVRSRGIRGRIGPRFPRMPRGGAAAAWEQQHAPPRFPLLPPPPPSSPPPLGAAALPLLPECSPAQLGSCWTRVHAASCEPQMWPVRTRRPRRSSVLCAQQQAPCQLKRELAWQAILSWLRCVRPWSCLPTCLASTFAPCCFPRAWAWWTCTCAPLWHVGGGHPHSHAALPPHPNRGIANLLSVRRLLHGALEHHHQGQRPVRPRGQASTGSFPQVRRAAAAACQAQSPPQRFRLRLECDRRLRAAWLPQQLLLWCGPRSP